MGWKQTATVRYDDGSKFEHLTGVEVEWSDLGDRPIVRDELMHVRAFAESGDCYHTWIPVRHLRGIIYLEKEKS